jgi:hypothetical protein
MWAIIVDSEISRIINNPQRLIIDDIKYSSKIFSLWSVEEKEAKGIYEIVHDNTNKKDEAYYINTNVSYDFDGSEVTASYGSPTAKALADANATDEAGVELDPVIVIEGLKTKHKRIIKQQASGLLTPTDWYILKATDVESYSVPSAITTYRANVRTKSNDMEVLIDACSTVDELATLYAYTEQEDGTFTRPLGEFPEAV